MVRLTLEHIVNFYMANNQERFIISLCARRTHKQLHFPWSFLQFHYTGFGVVVITERIVLKLMTITSQDSFQFLTKKDLTVLLLNCSLFNVI